MGNFSSDRGCEDLISFFNKIASKAIIISASVRAFIRSRGKYEASRNASERVAFYY